MTSSGLRTQMTGSGYWGKKIVSYSRQNLKVGLRVFNERDNQLRGHPGTRCCDKNNWTTASGGLETAPCFLPVCLFVCLPAACVGGHLITAWVLVPRPSEGERGRLN